MVSLLVVHELNAPGILGRPQFAKQSFDDSEMV